MKELDALLPSLFAQGKLNRLLHFFSLATRLGSLCVDEAGNELPGAAGANPCALCRAVLSTPNGRARCLSSICAAGRMAHQLGQPHIFRCHAGLIAISVPIIHQSRYLGSVSCGPMTLERWAEKSLDEFMRMTSGLNISLPSDLSEDDLPAELSSSQVAASSLIFTLVNQIVDSGMLAREQKQRLLAAAMERGQIEARMRTLENASPVYPMNKERELLDCVRLGNRNAARKILNELLSDIFMRSIGNLPVIKARILELVVVISRAAVEGGAKLEDLPGMDCHYIEQWSALDDFDEICLWLVRVLDAYMDAVYKMHPLKHQTALNDAVSLIRQQYAQSLTLGLVAQKVFVSPYYLSRLFKEGLNTTFLGYLTRTRIDAAKRLLSDTALPISEIARRTGYDDAGYFVKVFKKHAGATPSAYRTMMN